MPRADRLSPSGVKLLQEKHLAILSTIMPDGSPQATPVWVDVEPDGTHILINTVRGHVKADNVEAPAVQSAITSLKREALASKQMNPPITVRVNHDKTVAAVDIPLVGPGDDDVSFAALKTLRSDLLPATVGKLGDRVEYAVTGNTAGTKHFNDQMKSRLPFADMMAEAKERKPGWRVHPGRYVVHIGRSSADIAHELVVEVRPATA